MIDVFIVYVSFFFLFKNFSHSMRFEHSLLSLHPPRFPAPVPFSWYPLLVLLPLKRASLLGYQPNTAKEDIIELGTNPHSKAG